METLRSTGLVIDALGGNQGVAKLLGTTPKAVSNWRKTKLPANTYVVLQADLTVRGYSAPAQLWAMKSKKRKQKRRGKQ